MSCSKAQNYDGPVKVPGAAEGRWRCVRELVEGMEKGGYSHCLFCLIQLSVCRPVDGGGEGGGGEGWVSCI